MSPSACIACDGGNDSPPACFHPARRSLRRARSHEAAARSAAATEGSARRDLAASSIWFETEEGEVIGPVRVPPEASELAEVGWGITAAHFVRSPDGWRLVEIGNVYPNP